MKPRSTPKTIMSTTDFRLNMFKLFALMEDTGISFEFYHKFKVYRMYLEPTGKKYKRLRKSKLKVNPLTVTATKCDKCGDLRVSGICMNQRCIRSKPAQVATSAS